MRQSTLAVLVAVLVASTLAVVPAAVAQQTDTASDNATDASAAPGAQLSGVVGVQEAELNGDVASRAYGIRVAEANGSDERAAVVAEQVDTSQRRLAELAADREELEAARDNGSIGEGEYRARAATLYAEGQSVQRLADQTNRTASELPAETLEANGVNVTAIRMLSADADALTGGEIADIARDIAGPEAAADARGERGAAADGEVTEREATTDGEATERDGGDTGASERTPSTDETDGDSSPSPDETGDD